MKTLITTGSIASGNLFIRGVVWRDISRKTTKTQHMDTTITTTIITITINNPVTQVLPHRQLPMLPCQAQLLEQRHHCDQFPRTVYYLAQETACTQRAHNHGCQSTRTQELRRKPTLTHHGTSHGQHHNFNNNMAKTITITITITITTTGGNSPHISLEV